MRIFAKKLGRFLLWLFGRKEAGIFLALVGIALFVIAIETKGFKFESRFLQPFTLKTLAQEISLTAIMSLGVFVVIVTSGIDLSVGSVVAFAGIVAGHFMGMDFPGAVFIGLTAGIAAGALLGGVNGAIVSYVGVTPFIVTLGMLGMARGLVLVVTKGNSIRDIPESFVAFGQWKDPALGLPSLLLVLIAVAVLTHIVMRYSVFGRRVYAIGGNEDAAELSGINVKRVKFFTYVISGAYAALSGVIRIPLYSSAQAGAGQGQELDAIAAAVIGGTSLLGGEGSVGGVLIGAMIMGVVRKGLILMNVSPYWQQLVIGAIIVLAAVIDVLRNRRRN